jgi:hypothetical protein
LGREITEIVSSGSHPTGILLKAEKMKAKKKLRRSMWLPTEVTELAAEYHPARGGPPRKRE